MFAHCVRMIALIMLVVLMTGCRSSDTATPVPPTNTPVAPIVEPMPTAPPATESGGTSDTWTKIYGGGQDVVCQDILMADDGGYFIVGTIDLEFEPEMQGDIYLSR